MKLLDLWSPYHPAFRAVDRGKMLHLMVVSPQTDTANHTPAVLTDVSAPGGGGRKRAAPEGKRS